MQGWKIKTSALNTTTCRESTLCARVFLRGMFVRLRYLIRSCIWFWRKTLKKLIMPLMIDGPDQLQEWLDWTWPRHNAFLACWKPTRNTEPECLSAALLAPLTEWCLLQCTTVLQEDYVRRSRIAGQKMCFSRNCFSLSKIPGQNFGAVSSAVAVYLCAHLWSSSLLSYPVSESALSIPQWKNIPHLHPEPQWMH